MKSSWPLFIFRFRELQKPGREQTCRAFDCPDLQETGAGESGDPPGRFDWLSGPGHSGDGQDPEQTVSSSKSAQCLGYLE
jgi:hypothetical protein